jgi:uncharacterized membrane protein
MMNWRRSNVASRGCASPCAGDVPVDLRAHREMRAWREYASGVLWVLPGASMGAALVLGALLSTVWLSTHTPLRRLLFQGTWDDARTSAPI